MNNNNNRLPDGVKVCYNMLYWVVTKGELAIAYTCLHFNTNLTIALLHYDGLDGDTRLLRTPNRSMPN